MARGFRGPVAVLALAFFLVTRVYPTRIMVFTTLFAVILVFALALYLRLMFTGALPRAGFVAAGIAMLLTGAAMLLGNMSFTFIWTFDRNASYHLMQMAGLLFFYLGLSQRGSWTP